MNDGLAALLFVAVVSTFSLGSCLRGRDSMRQEVKAACAEHCFPLAVHPEMELVCQCATTEGGSNE